MSRLTRLIKRSLESRGVLVQRISRDQVFPADLPNAEWYTRPEDYSRLLKIWRSAEYQKLFTPAVVNHTFLSPMKLYYLHRLLLQAMGCEGDILEAGVGNGGSARLMLETLHQANGRKSLWLLDTFEGYQKVDAAKDGVHLRVNQCKCASVEEVRTLLANSQTEVHVIKGLIPGTLAQVKAERIAFAHIDVNLHEPTYAATEFCLERMSAGGVILFDDYCWPATYGARMAIEEVCAKHGQNLISLSEQAFLIRR